MDALIKYGIYALIVAAVAGGVWKAWDSYVAEPYREDGRKEVRTDELEPLKAKHTKLEAAVAEQNRLVAEQQRRDKERAARAAAEARAAQARADAAETRVRTLLATQPAFPDDPCRSACLVLGGAL